MSKLSSKTDIVAGSFPPFFTAECGKEIDFTLPEGVERTFLKNFFDMFQFLVEPSVGSSYVLHCMLDRPAEWAPGDVDIYLTDEIPILFDFVYKWISQSMVVKSTSIMVERRTKIDVQFPNQTFSFIFRRAIAAVQEFDISVCSMWIPLRMLIDETVHEPVNMVDATVIADVMNRRMRVHPYVLGTKTSVNFNADVLKDLTARMQKYQQRGFTAYADPDEKNSELRLASLEWYYEHPESVSDKWKGVDLDLSSLKNLYWFGTRISDHVIDLMVDNIEHTNKRARTDAE